LVVAAAALIPQVMLQLVVQVAAVVQMKVVFLQVLLELLDKDTVEVMV
jgi:hypothetical protein